MSTPSSAIEACARFLRDAGTIVVSTGAGMSKESGIPTFRDAPNALWANYDPEQLATVEGFRRDPELVWRWYADRRRMIAAAKPHAGHYAIVHLGHLHGNVTVLTQNIDNLHREAAEAGAAGGFSTDNVADNVIELHGNIFRYKCIDAEHPIDTLPESDEVPPKCHCGSLIRPAIVWFGELLPNEALERTHAALESCDAMLVVGTSGLVHPAAGFPADVKRRGATVVEINPEPTPITPGVDLFLKGPAGEILPRIIERFEIMLEERTS